MRETSCWKGRVMGGRRALKAGLPRMLGRHDGREGRMYRRVYDALAAEYAFSNSLLQFEAGRVAALAVQLVAANRALVAARRERRLGKGRRPGNREIECLARRAGLADGSYSAALDKFRALAAERPRDVAARLADARQQSASTGSRKSLAHRATPGPT